MEDQDRGSPEHDVGEPTLPPAAQELQTCNVALKNQLEFYKQEQTSLRADLSALVEENQQLGAQLKVALGVSLGQEPAGECRRRTADMIANLQRQLLFASQEKAAAAELYQKALKEMQALEAEILAFRESAHDPDADAKLEDMKCRCTDTIKSLQDALEKMARDLEKDREQVAKLEEELSRLRLEKDRMAALLDDRGAQVEDALAAQQAATIRADAASERGQCLENELERLGRERDDLEAALLDTTRRAEELARREWAAISHVEEALTLVDAAVLEKDAAQASEARAQEEVSRLERSSEQLMEEAAKQLTEEKTKIKQQCNAQLEGFLKEAQYLQEELTGVKSQMDKANNDIGRLEQELDNMRREQASLPDTVALQHSLDNAYRELRRLENYNTELQVDREKLLQRFDEAEKKYCSEVCGSREEVLLLKQELQALRAHADQAEANAQARTMLLEDQLSNLEQQLNALQCAWQPAVPQEDSSHAQCEQQLEEYRGILAQMSEMQQRGMHVAHELQSHLDRQTEAKLKWQREVKTLSSRFEQRIESLRGQLGGLKRANINMMQHNRA